MSIQRAPWIAYRFIFVWVVDALSILITTALPVGIHITADNALQSLSVALSVALVTGLLNLVVRPVLLVLTLPLNVLTIGLLNIPINALILGLAAWLIPSFAVSGAGAALMGSLIISAVNTFLTSLTTVDDNHEFYQGVVEWLSQRQRVSPDGVTERGILMVEIDGLSHDRLLYAVRRGYMPTLRAMLEGGQHHVSVVECGLPSQTSACQAGILFGDNYDIPAFRWWDKAEQRLIVSNKMADARLLDERLSHGRGLLRGGSSVGNMLAGDAMKSVLTMSTMDPRTPDEDRWRQEDLYLFFLNPYIFTRSLILTIVDLFRELAQALRDQVTNRQPRINRLDKGYPAIRAATNVFLRDLETFLVALDIIRGMPAIYTSLIGYDEVAHHAGPDSPDAYQTLHGIDAAVRHLPGHHRPQAGGGPTISVCPVRPRPILRRYLRAALRPHPRRASSAGGGGPRDGSHLDHGPTRRRFDQGSRDPTATS
ncbi:MAG: phage holin family protein [Anaerolineae bacterium]|nr:phage holin family protein [Anaerolineae bacterium]